MRLSYPLYFVLHAHDHKQTNQRADAIMEQQLKRPEQVKQLYLAAQQSNTH